MSARGEPVQIDISRFAADTRPRLLPGAEQPGERLAVRPLGWLAREFWDEGGPPPVPRPTVGHVVDVELLLFYPGLNAVAGPAGTGKSLLTKYLGRQRAEGGSDVLVLDCETNQEEYTATLVADLAMGEADLDRVLYVADAQGRTRRRDRWSGLGEDSLEQALADLDCAPSLVVIDSQSKSMALQGLDENRPVDVTQWFETTAALIVDRWPAAAVVSIQGRQKGYFKGMDVRQGRGSSSLLHEVHAQYMLWTKDAGSRTQDGEATLVCTKDRYGHRAEGSKAARWRYGPGGFALLPPQDGDVDDLPDPSVVRKALIGWLEEDLRDPVRPALPPKYDYAVGQVASRLGLTSAAGRDLVTQTLDQLIKADRVERHKVAQPGVPGVRPWRVWRSGRADPAWEWDE